MIAALFSRYFLFTKPTWVFIYMFYTSKERIPGFFLCAFLSCFFVVHDASWGYQYTEAKLTVESRLFCHFSRSLTCTSNLGLITTHFFNLPVKFTIFSALGSSMISYSPMEPWFIIIVRNQTITLEYGLMKIWCLPFFLTLLILLISSGY